jgi:hypothetical protein
VATTDIDVAVAAVAAPRTHCHINIEAKNVGSAHSIPY